MSDNIAVEPINSEYLEEENLNRFNKIRSIIESEYAKVLSSINEPTIIPYIPRVYVIPCIVRKEQRRGSVPFRLWYYNLIYIDPKNFERFAIFSSLNFLEKFQEYIAGGLGHEIAHILQLRGKVDLNKNMLRQQLKAPYQTEIKKEREAEDTYRFFNEPVRSIIRKWNMLCTYPEIKNEFVNGSEIVDFKTFEKLIFGNRQSEFNQFIKRKLKEIGYQNPMCAH